MCYGPLVNFPRRNPIQVCADACRRWLAVVPAPVRGILLMLLAALSVTAMNVTIRQLSQEIHVFEIAFWRHLFGTFVLQPLVARAPVARLRTRRFDLHALRAVLNLAAMLTFLVGLTLIPLAEVTALSFTSPLFAAALAVIVLKEFLGPRRLISLIVGFVGALVILRPGFQEVSIGSLCIVGSSAIWACALICIKVASRTESSVAITLWGAMMQAPMSLAFALFYWQWPTPDQFALLVMIAAFGSFSQVALTQAFAYADATLVMPADFTKLIWASFAGYLLFAEIPGNWTILGAAIICAGILYGASGAKKSV
jgi:drug/metabolite transporter (DMT)-like permease